MRSCQPNPLLSRERTFDPILFCYLLLQRTMFKDNKIFTFIFAILVSYPNSKQVQIDAKI